MKRRAREGAPARDPFSFQPVQINMELREKLEQNQKPLAIAVGVLVVVAIVVAFFSLRSNRGGGFGGSSKPQFYYTVDDGKTWFEDDATRLPPFDHDGKQAVRVQLYKCGDSGQPFVGYLQRIEEKARKAAEAARAAGKRAQDVEALYQYSLEVKKPGSPKWVSTKDMASEAIMIQKCPDGKTIPMVVLP
jgi:hypothetical protein